MRIIEAVERAPIVIAISDVMNEDGGFAFLPDVLQKGYFDVDYRGNELILVAGKYIGQIPLTPHLGIHVKPKVPLSNLARVISVANQSVRCLEFFRRTYAISLEASASFQEGLARSLVRSLRELDKEGIYREYHRRTGVFTVPRGRVALNEYLRGGIARGKPSHVPSIYYEFTADTIFNRIIKAALWILGRSLAAQNCKDRELTQGLEYFFDVFQPVKLDINETLIKQAEVALSRGAIPELRSYYIDILDVALVVLNRESLDISSHSGKVRSHSFILSMEETFERYIREVLRGSAVLRKRGFVVEDGNMEARRPLFIDNLTYDAKPDFVIGPRGNVKLIGDAKYKNRLAENDRYQLISHAVAYGADNAFFVVPLNENQASGPLKVGTIGTKSPVSVHQYKFDLDCINLEEEERRLVEWVDTLIG